MSAVLPDTALPGDFGAAIDARARVVAQPAGLPTVSAPSSAPLSAVERIEISRARLRRALTPASAGRNAASGAPARWWDKFKSLPGVSVVIDALTGWWAQHPLRPVAEVGVEASQTAVQPLARKHPVALVVLAALAGAVMVRSRPWRWIFRSALFAGLVPQLASHAVAKLPIESWLTMIASALSAPSRSAASATPPEHPAA